MMEDDVYRAAGRALHKVQKIERLLVGMLTCRLVTLENEVAESESCGKDAILEAMRARARGVNPWERTLGNLAQMLIPKEQRGERLEMMMQDVINNRNRLAHRFLIEALEDSGCKYHTAVEWLDKQAEFFDSVNDAFHGALHNQLRSAGLADCSSEEFLRELDRP